MFGKFYCCITIWEGGQENIKTRKGGKSELKCDKNNNWDWKREKRGKAVNDLTANTKHASQHEIRDERHTR